MQGCDALGHLLGLLDALLGQKPLRFRRGFWVFAIDGDSVAHNIKLHQNVLPLHGMTGIQTCGSAGTSIRHSLLYQRCELLSTPTSVPRPIAENTCAREILS